MKADGAAGASRYTVTADVRRPRASVTVELRRSARQDPLEALLDVERAARAYARHSHGNIGLRAAYLAREEAREQLRDALARLDVARGG